jgi:thiamine kinase-like enzyme
MQTLEKECCSSILLTDTFYSFHGDFILDNIIKTKDSYVLIDWRHEFDNELSYGDIYYDLAKLRHNLFLNHKNINDGLFTIQMMDGSGGGDSDGEESSSVRVDMKCNYFLIQQFADYDRFIKENGYDMNKIRIITSLIWLNMSSLYEGDFGKFLFYFGKYHLFLSLHEMGMFV